MQLLAIHDPDAFVSTRDSLHRVAEHVLAKARFLDDGEIRLVAVDGGFGTPMLSGKTRVRVAGVDLVIDDHNGSRGVALTTIGNAARFAGIEPGFPTELYQPATRLDADESLDVDLDAAQALAAWYGFTAELLGAFAGEVVEAHPSPLILWPEHFDQAFFTEDDDESRRANYGASPGDAGHPEPYLYVGPWGSTAADEFWNAPTFNGALLPLSSLIAAVDPAAQALQFLRAGRALLAPRA
jgi:hypothetical protein